MTTAEDKARILAEDISTLHCVAKNLNRWRRRAKTWKLAAKKWYANDDAGEWMMLAISRLGRNAELEAKITDLQNKLKRQKEHFDRVRAEDEEMNERLFEAAMDDERKLCLDRCRAVLCTNPNGSYEEGINEGARRCMGLISVG